MTATRLSLPTLAATAVMGLLAAAQPAWAAPTLYTETDSGALPTTAETAGAVGSSLTIAGKLLDGKGGNAPNIVDLYSFTIGSASQYRFDTFGSAIVDPALFLFDGTGAGLFWNNDASASPVNTQSAFTTFLNPGTYYIGFAFYGVDPDDGSGLGIFDTVGGNEGPALAGASALSDWMDFYGQTLWDLVDYRINISDVPEPGVFALTLTALALGAGLGRRRARAA